MIKILTAILSTIAFLVIVAIPVYAFDPLNPTDNATAQYVFTDNFTLTFGGPLIFNATLTGLEAAMTASTEAGATIIANEIDAMWMDLFALLLLVLINAWAFWQKSDFLYIMATPVDLIYGLNLAGDSVVYSPEWVMGVVIAIVGLRCLYVVVAKYLLPYISKAITGKG